VPSIFFLAGAPAVGKSTTAHALAAHFQKSIHIPVDDIRSMVVSGVEHPGVAWGRGLIEQLAVARECVTQMALSYRSAGFTVAIDDFWDPNSMLREYQRLFQSPDVHRILLYPSRQAAEVRNQKRDGSAYITDGIRTVYENLQAEIPTLEHEGWRIVDTTDMDIEATVSDILARAG